MRTLKEINNDLGGTHNDRANARQSEALQTGQNKRLVKDRRAAKSKRTREDKKKFFENQTAKAADKRKSRAMKDLKNEINQQALRMGISPKQLLEMLAQEEYENNLDEDEEEDGE